MVASVLESAGHLKCFELVFNSHQTKKSYSRNSLIFKSPLSGSIDHLFQPNSSIFLLDSCCSWQICSTSTILNRDDAI
jgi:hypothetical protein